MLHPIYILVYIVLLGFTLSEFNKDIKSEKVPFFFMIAILIWLGGFRYYQGADFPIYVNLFYASHRYVPWDDLSSGGVESSYTLLSKIVGEVFKAPFYWITFIYCFLSLSLKGGFFYKFSPYPFLSLLLFYMPVIFFEDYGQMRQGLSIGVCAFAFRYIVKRKLIFFILTVIVAYFIHKSAIFFIFAYWIAPLKIKTNMALLAVIISIVLWPLEVYRLLGPLVSTIATEDVSAAYTGYLDDRYYGVETGFGLSDIVKAIWLIIIFAFDKEMYKLGTKYLYPRNLTLFFFCIFYLCRGNAIFAIRLPGAYAFYLYLLIPTIIFYLDEYYKKMIFNYVIIFSIAIFVRFQPIGKSGGFHKFNNALLMKNPQYKNEVY